MIGQALQGVRRWACAFCNLFINILKNVGCMPIKFVDHMRPGGNINHLMKRNNLKKHLDRLSGELDLTKLLAGINVNIISRFANQLCGYRMRKMWLISVSYHH